VVDEAGEDVWIGGAVRSGLVVNLPADHGGMVLVMADEIDN
jgi:hypothetical protein